MLRTRVIPCLLLRDGVLVKTTRYKKPSYIGDPINTVRIFNELEVDELAFLDIAASREGRGPDFERLAEIADECFMPLSYGGGVSDLDTAERVLQTGFEKVVVNTASVERPDLIGQLARRFGSQSVIVAIDVRKPLLRKRCITTRSGARSHAVAPTDWARRMEDEGAGELLLTSIDREGTWTGFDAELTREVADAVRIPVIAHGGAGSVDHIVDVVRSSGASAVALGNMVVYQKQGMGVLVNFPDRAVLLPRLAQLEAAEGATTGPTATADAHAPR